MSPKPICLQALAELSLAAVLPVLLALTVLPTTAHAYSLQPPPPVDAEPVDLTGVGGPSEVIERRWELLRPASQLGSTGNSTGPHVHFEVWQGQSKVNPLSLMPAPPDQ
jgi:hypothetical protein